MIQRTLTEKLIMLGNKFPIVTLTGPRQSGKSTLLRSVLPHYKYVSMEDPDNQLIALDDPRGFLKTYSDKTIIDEVQRVPDLFSYLQTHVDNENKEGMYYLAGSQNFLLMQSISQSLAGRTAILKLLPFSHEELRQAGLVPSTSDEEIFYGGYPRIYDKGIHPSDFYSNYIQTYVEKDLRLLKNIDNLSKFIRFIKLCAGRIGQLLNLSSLANEAGVAVSTVQSWLSVLEASYILYLLKPDHNNYAKRLIKSPKLYFYDTGLACSLHTGQTPRLTFWRDSTGNEVDLLVSLKGKQKAYEIKSGATFSTDDFKGIKVWSKLSGAHPEDCHVIYNGDRGFATSFGGVIPWSDLSFQ